MAAYKYKRIIAFATLIMTALSIGVRAADIEEVKYSAKAIVNASTGNLAPFMIGSWNADRTTMKNTASAVFTIEKEMDYCSCKRFSWGAGAELMSGYNHEVRYERYDDGTWGSEWMSPAAVTLRTLYAEARYRSLYAQIGMKDHQSKIVDGRLSSGDLVRSNNARAIPGITIGFVDFRDIPFTNGWLQIDGRIMYGKLTDNGFRRKQFSHYYGLLATDLYYTYKYCYFRTKPSERFSVIFGMQTAGMFGGNSKYYEYGKLHHEANIGFRFKDLFKMFFPLQGNGNGYYEGNSLGAWSMRARYRLQNESELAVYWEKFFEDGSGIGCRNGMDGLYGIQFTIPGQQWLGSVVVEYLDFRNQSGPLHWAPGDHKKPTIGTESTGGDNYYNNDSFGPYTNYGMSIGSPMVVAPVYNLDGYPEYLYNRMRGVHFGALGNISPKLAYKLMAGWQKGYANGRIPLPYAKSDFSAMAGIDWQADRLCKGLSVSCKVAIDRGELRGDNFGAMLSVAYTGSFDLIK